MGIITLQTMTIVFYILGFTFTWCTPENTTLRVLPETGIVTTPLNNSSVHPETRIVGGEETGVHEFPHHVLVVTEVQTNGKSGFALCGGSLVTRNYVLTAAHCVEKGNPDKTRIFAGAPNYINRDRSRQSSSALKIFVHRCYNPRATQNIRNDIALIKLRQPVTFEDFVQPIKIDVVNRARVGRSVTVLGWGRTRDFDEESLADVLKKAQLNIISERQCVRSLGVPFLDYDDQICAGAGFGSACQGDSGGALICTENDERYVCGITSFVSSRGCSRGPSGYTRVSHFKNWIYDVVKNGRDSSMDCVGEVYEGRGSMITLNGFSYVVIILISFQYFLLSLLP